MKRGPLGLSDFLDLMDEWHPSKNDGLDVFGIPKSSKKKVWWLGKCGHEYQLRVDSRTTGGYGCPYCGRKKKIGPVSITHPELVHEWHVKNEIKPDEVTSGTHVTLWWLGKCGHEWAAPLHNRTKPNKPSGCPYCSNRMTDISNCLSSKHPELIEEWHPTKNGDLSPDKINYRSYKKVHWQGRCGHEWLTMVRMRTRKIAAGCPLCLESKGEIEIKRCLREMGLEFEPQAKFDTCRSKRRLPFDFRVGNLLIEYQGQQHYEPVNFGGNHLDKFAEVQRHDEIKRKWCRENGYKLLEIKYTDLRNIEAILKEVLQDGSQN